MRLPCVCCEPLRIPLISFSPSSHSLSLSPSLWEKWHPCQLPVRVPVPSATDVSWQSWSRGALSWDFRPVPIIWRTALMGTVRLSFTYRQKNQGRFQHCHAVEDAPWAFSRRCLFLCRKLSVQTLPKWCAQYLSLSHAREPPWMR